MPQNTATYSFKSSGLTAADEQQLQSADLKDLPLGLQTPLQFANFDAGLFRMHKELAPMVIDNFRNMLLTNHGERMVHQDFGANLRELTFELGAEDVDALAMQRIQATTSKYMPYIKLLEFSTTTDHLDNEHVAKRIVSVMFNIPGLGAFNKQIDITLFIGG